MGFEQEEAMVKETRQLGWAIIVVQNIGERFSPKFTPIEVGAFERVVKLATERYHQLREEEKPKEG